MRDVISDTHQLLFIKLTSNKKRISDTLSVITAVEQILWPVGLTSSYIIEVVVCLIP